MRLPFFILICFFLLGCGAQQTTDLVHVVKGKRVGIIEVQKGSRIFKKQYNNTFDVTGNQGGRFLDGLKAVQKRLNTKDLFKQRYITSYSKKGAEVVLIKEYVTIETLRKFEKPDNKKNYAVYDFGWIKEKYNLDDLLIIEVKYGISLVTQGVVVMEKYGYANLANTLVDLSDNTIVLGGAYEHEVRITEKWNTPPEYDNLYNPIWEAIEGVVVQL